MSNVKLGIFVVILIIVLVALGMAPSLRTSIRCNSVSEKSNELGYQRGIADTLTAFEAVEQRHN